MTLTIGLIIAALVILGLGCVVIAVFIAAPRRIDEMAEEHGDVVEVPKDGSRGVLK